MFKNLKVKSKLLIISIIPIIVLLAVAIITTSNTNNISSSLEKTLYNELYKSSALLLNGDRDMYQALSVFQEIIKGNISENDRKNLVNLFNENKSQAISRAKEANTVLLNNRKLWESEKSSSGQTISEILDKYDSEFELWVSDANKVITSGGVIVDFINSDLNKSYENIRAYLNDAQEILDVIANKQMRVLNEERNISLIIVLVIIAATVIIVLILSVYFITSILSPLKKAVNMIKQMAEGDLRQRLNLKLRDEIGVMTGSMDLLADNLNDIIAKIDISAEQVSSGAHQVSDSSMVLSGGATEQASSVEELSASIEEIYSQIKLNTENAAKANNLAHNTKSAAENGNRSMKEMLKSMDDINNSSNSIYKIIKVIDDIAFQTNILALNAAVEAARAGQHGKGFAVVAEEVRNLAARSANAAKETTDMIENSIKKVEDGTKIAHDTSAALKSIYDEVEKVSDLINSIATASNEQSMGIEQINQGIMQVSSVVQSNSATSEESAAASEELSSQAELLKEQVSMFKLKENNQNIRFNKENELKAYDSKSLEILQNKTVKDKKQSKEVKQKEPEEAGVKKTIMLNDNEFGKY